MPNSIFTASLQGRKLGRTVGLAKGEALALDDQAHETIGSTDLLYCPWELCTLWNKRRLKIGRSVSR